MDELTPEDAVHVAIDDLLTVVAKAGGGLVTTNGYSCDELKALINEMQAIVEAQPKRRTRGRLIPALLLILVAIAVVAVVFWTLRGK